MLSPQSSVEIEMYKKKVTNHNKSVLWCCGFTLPSGRKRVYQRENERQENQIYDRASNYPPIRCCLLVRPCARREGTIQPSPQCQIRGPRQSGTDGHAPVERLCA